MSCCLIYLALVMATIVLLGLGGYVVWTLELLFTMFNLIFTDEVHEHSSRSSRWSGGDSKLQPKGSTPCGCFPEGNMAIESFDPIRARLTYECRWGDLEEFVRKILGTAHPDKDLSFLRAVRIIDVRRLTCTLLTTAEDKARMVVEYE